MKNLLICLSAASCFLNSSFVEGKECALCERIRAENAAHHHNYEYYEDYQKDEGKEPASDESPKTEKPIDGQSQGTPAVKKA